MMIGIGVHRQLRRRRHGRASSGDDGGVTEKRLGIRGRQIKCDNV